jgi:hypothetical protein
VLPGAEVSFESQADTDSKVIHCGSGSKVLRDRITAAADVKNFATAGKIVVNSLPSAQNSDGCGASSPARFTPSHPQRVAQRAPAGSKASAQRSERTPSHEDFCISSTGGAAALERKSETSKIMKDWKEITHYAGFDWATDGTRKEYMESVATVPLLIIDDFGMRKLPHTAAEDLLEIVMRRYERFSTLLTSNRPVEDWGKLLGDVAAVSAMLDRLLHHGHVLKCGPRSWRTKTAATS